MIPAGKLFVMSVLKHKDVEAMFKFGNVEVLMLENEMPAYKFVADFVLKHGAVPELETLQTHLPGFVPVPAAEPAGYYADLMERRWIEKKVRDTLQEVNDAYQQGALKDPVAARETLLKAQLDLKARKHADLLFDLRQLRTPIKNHLSNTVLGDGKPRLNLGWPTLDNMTGGLMVGDFIAYVGRPGMGKSAQVLYGMLYDWIRYELDLIDIPQRRLFVSMEMSMEQMQLRAAALIFRINQSNLNKGLLSSFAKSNLDKGLIKLEGYKEPFWIMDGNLAATVDEIEGLAQMLKPTGIAVDGGYLLKHPTEKDRFRRAAENAELIKQRLCPLAPTVSSWQFAKPKGGKKEKKGEKPNLDDIGYTDAIAQLATVAVGLTENDDAEKKSTRIVEILKGRNGETGSFTTNFDWNNMDFTEITPVDLAKMQIG